MENYLSRHAAINIFTETELYSVQRGRVADWPARPGRRGSYDPALSACDRKYSPVVRMLSALGKWFFQSDEGCCRPPPSLSGTRYRAAAGPGAGPPRAAAWHDLSAAGNCQPE